jgi:hypothetical protein
MDINQKTTITDLITAINNNTEINIVGDPDGDYVWQWRCLESDYFKSPELALIDFIQHICGSYEELLIAQSKDDDADDDTNEDTDIDKRIKEKSNESP